MVQPKEEDIAAAKSYLRQRLDAEYSMTYNLGIVMRKAAEEVCEIMYAANIAPTVVSYDSLPPRVQKDVDEVIQRLKETVDDYFRTLALAEHEEEKDEILPIILEKNHGMTFDERLTDYCDKYKKELSLLIGAGLFLGVAEDVLVKSIGDNLRHPYANQLLSEGIAAPISYGRGRTNSMFTAISDLTAFGISVGWMKAWYKSTKSDGALGWWVQRGSSYPCEHCDSMVGFHIHEEELPPYHLSCRCFAIPIY